MSKDNIVYLNIPTTLDISPERILEAAKDKLQNVVIIGLDNENELYFASSEADVRSVLFKLEKAKKFLLDNF